MYLRPAFSSGSRILYMSRSEARSASDDRALAEIYYLRGSLRLEARSRNAGRRTPRPSTRRCASARPSGGARAERFRWRPVHELPHGDGPRTFLRMRRTLRRRGLDADRRSEPREWGFAACTFASSTPRSMTCASPSSSTRRIGDSHAAMYALHNIGNCLTLAGRYGEASEVQPATLERVRSLKARRFEAGILWGCAEPAQRRPVELGVRKVRMVEARSAQVGAGQVEAGKIEFRKGACRRNRPRRLPGAALSAASTSARVISAIVMSGEVRSRPRMASCASAAQIGAIAIASASVPCINRMGEPSLRRVATGSALWVVALRSLSLSDLLVARESASPQRNALRRMLVRPLGDLGRRLNRALHQRLLRSELQPLFVALARRIERAYRQNQTRSSPSCRQAEPHRPFDCGILKGWPQRRCHTNLDRRGGGFGRPAELQAAVAARHVRNASSRRTRSGRRDVR